MTTAIVTGSAGLVGAAACRKFASLGMNVVGIDNNMRERMFGSRASSWPTVDMLKQELGSCYQHENCDIRDWVAIDNVFWAHPDTSVVVHAAAQPSHDYATRRQKLDRDINYLGTANVLEVAKQHAPDAAFIFVSTNKVYGDATNGLGFMEQETRWDATYRHMTGEYGIDETLTIDQSRHSLFGASKLAADILVQEYGHTFGLKTACFRCGCLTGPDHAGTELHGFLSHMVRCCVRGETYKVIGYSGKQVRDNLHAGDLAEMFACFASKPGIAKVYNAGGGRENSCSVIEAISLVEELSGQKITLDWSLADQPRGGDHRWWITDTLKFREEYPGWSVKHSLRDTLSEMITAVRTKHKV